MTYSLDASTQCYGGEISTISGGRSPWPPFGRCSDNCRPICFGGWILNSVYELAIFRSDGLRALRSAVLARALIRTAVEALVLNADGHSFRTPLRIRDRLKRNMKLVCLPTVGAVRGAVLQGEPWKPARQHFKDDSGLLEIPNHLRRNCVACDDARRRSDMHDRSPVRVRYYRTVCDNLQFQRNILAANERACHCLDPFATGVTLAHAARPRKYCDVRIAALGAPEHAVQANICRVFNAKIVLQLHTHDHRCRHALKQTWIGVIPIHLCNAVCARCIH